MSRKKVPQKMGATGARVFELTRVIIRPDAGWKDLFKRVFYVFG